MWTVSCLKVVKMGVVLFGCEKIWMITLPSVYRLASLSEMYPGILLNFSNKWQHYTFCLLTLCLFSLPGDMDISVLSKYISGQKRVYPGVEGRITVTSSGSSSSTAHSLDVLLLLPLCLALSLWGFANTDKTEASSRTWRDAYIPSWLGERLGSWLSS